MPIIPDIKREDVIIDGLWEIYNKIKTIVTTHDEHYKVLNALYCVGIFGEFTGDNPAVLHVDGQRKDKKARAFFPAAKYLFALETFGFRIFDLVLTDSDKPRNRLAMKDILHFKISFPDNESMLMGLKTFASACGKIVGDPFFSADIRVAFDGAPKLYAPPIDEVFRHLTDGERTILTAIHEKLSSLGCTRNLEREYMMRYIHPKAKGKTFATIYLVNQAWLSVSGEITDINLKFNLRHIGDYIEYLDECTDSIKRSVKNAENCGVCKKACGGVSFEFEDVKYCKCPWHIFRFNDFSGQAMENYIKLIDLESSELK